MSGRDIETEADVKDLLDRFYHKAMTDPVIGFIFTDVAHISMEKHMPVMYSFWSSMLLGNRSYAGNPMEKHVELNRKVKLTSEHFSRWLLLWEDTVRQNFVGEKANEAVSRSKNIASLMQFKIQQSIQSK